MFLFNYRVTLVEVNLLIDLIKSKIICVLQVLNIGVILCSECAL